MKKTVAVVIAAALLAALAVTALLLIPRLIDDAAFNARRDALRTGRWYSDEGPGTSGGLSYRIPTGETPEVYRGAAGQLYVAMGGQVYEALFDDSLNSFALVKDGRCVRYTREGIAVTPAPTPTPTPTVTPAPTPTPSPSPPDDAEPLPWDAPAETEIEPEVVRSRPDLSDDMTPNGSD